MGLLGRSKPAADPAKYTRRQAIAAAERLEVLSAREMQAGRPGVAFDTWKAAHRYREVARKARR